MNLRHPLAIGLLSLITLSSCTTGLSSVLFMTKTETAIDFDTQPPSLDIGYARDELVLAPIFEDGQVLPVLTTMGGRQGAFNFGSSQSFATGDAALVFADALTDLNEYDLGGEGKVPYPNLERTPKKPLDGVITTVDETPPDGFWETVWWSVAGSSKRKRYFFGTDTSFGLHVEWSGNTVPRSVALGFKRKELAWVPLVEKDGPEVNGKPTKEIRLASLLATSNAQARIAGTESTETGQAQAFATGYAATLLSKHAAVRQVLAPAFVLDFDEIQEEQRALGLAGAQSVQNFVILSAIHSGLTQLAASGDSEAQKHLDLIDVVGKNRETFDFTDYGVVVGQAAQVRATSVTDSASDFLSLIAFATKLKSSIEILEEKLDPTTGTLTVVHSVPAPAAIAAGPVDLSKTAPRKPLEDDLEAMKEALSDFESTYGMDRILIDAVTYYFEVALN